MVSQKSTLIAHRQVFLGWKSIKHPSLLIVVRPSLYIVASPECTLPVPHRNNLGWKYNLFFICFATVPLNLWRAFSAPSTLLVPRLVILGWKSIKHPSLLIVVRLSL
jgi:hypothetical protein